MSKRKGLSLEEKRDKVLEVFTESADVFVLKVHDTTNNVLTRALAACEAMLCPLYLSCWGLGAGCREVGLEERCCLADYQRGLAGVSGVEHAAVIQRAAGTLQQPTQQQMECKV